MPFLKEAQLLPVKGINLAVPSTFLPQGYGFPHNLTYVQAELRKRDGKSQVGGVTIGAHKVLHLFVAEDSTLSQTLFRFTRYNIQKYVSATDSFSDITGTDLTGGETNFFDCAVVSESDVLISTNYIDNLRKFLILSGTATADVGGAPPKARYCEYLTPYLLLANLNDSGNALPWTVRWSDSGNYQKWNGGNAGSVVLSHEPSGIRALKKLGNQVMCYKERSIYRGNPVSTSAIFDFGGPFVTGEGLFAPRSVATANERHYFMGLNDFYSNDGVRRQSVGGPIREYVFNRLNRSLNETCFAIPVDLYKEVWFFVTIAGQSWPTEVWKYKWDLDFWYFDTIENCITAANYKVVNSLTWDTAIGTWDEQQAFWDAQSGQADSPVQVFGYDTGFTYKRDENTVNDYGNAVIGKFETKDFSGLVIGDRAYDVEWAQLEFWAKGDYVDVHYSTDYGTTWTYVTRVTLSGSFERQDVFFDVIAPHMRFKFENRDAGKTFTLQDFTPFYMHEAEEPI